MKRILWIIIIICIVLLIIAIAIPNNYSSRKAANETSAISALKAIRAAQDIWKQTDPDDNGINDYWTYDVSGMYRMLKDGMPAAYITIDLAKSDAGWHKDNTFGRGTTENWESISTTLGPKAGYYVQAMLADENGTPYNRNTLHGIKSSNPLKYAFVAYPAAYGSSGDLTYIMCEDGIVYAADCGSEQDKIIRYWPGKDPTTTITPNARYWHNMENGSYYSRNNNSPLTFWGVLVLIIIIISTGYVLFKKDDKNQAQVNAGK
ncbi:MAG: DUF2950 family protein [Planctomycetes bacterium]|nr:DUF2950 family protein [Planctomycetota bacterium]